MVCVMLTFSEKKRFRGKKDKGKGRKNVKVFVTVIRTAYRLKTFIVLVPL